MGLFLTVCGYFLGSIPFCRWLPLLWMGVDVTRRGDGNPGATNVFQACGRWMGSLCLTCDLAKGAIPVLVGVHLLPAHSPWLAAVVAAPVLGHGFSVFLHFRGGKCIATVFGVLIGLMPVSPVVWCLVICYIVFGFARFPSGWRRCRATFACFLPAVWCWTLWARQPAVGLGVTLASGVCLMKHWMCRSQPEAFTLRKPRPNKNSQ